MKKIILSLTLLMISATSFGGNIPTTEEYRAIMDMIGSDVTLKGLIRDIKNGKINPITENEGGVIISRPGRSGFGTSLINRRFNVNNLIGDEKENLELLELIIKKGMGVNVLQPDFGDKLGEATPLERGALVCSMPAINLLLKNGADPTLEGFYFVRSHKKGIYFYEEEEEETIKRRREKCAEVTDFMLKKAGERPLSLWDTREVFDSNKPNDLYMSLLNGWEIDQYSDESKNIIHTKFGIKFSKRPSGDEPSDEWWGDFKDGFESGAGTNIGGTLGDSGQKQWARFSNTEKEWACYYSTIDEIVTAFNKLGFDDNSLVSTDIFKTGRFSLTLDQFSVYTFGRYCNSIK